MRPRRARTILVLIVGVVSGAFWIAAQRASEPAALRVCADPNNLPFSNEAGQGFENALAVLLASHLNRRLEYTWSAQRRGFIRETLRAGLCDVVMGVPAAFELTLTTRPYYRSSYVFVSRTADRLDVRSLDDERLKRWRVGVQMVGDDFSNSPPAHGLAYRGAVNNVVGYSVVGDYRQPNPPARIVDAVIDGDVDVAIVWGPLAGYFAARSPVSLALTPVSPAFDLPFRPYLFDISMGVRREDTELVGLLDRFIDVRRAEIDALLDAYHVPRLPLQVHHR
jgi:mxaJ protein